LFFDGPAEQRAKNVKESQTTRIVVVVVVVVESDVSHFSWAILLGVFSRSVSWKFSPNVLIICTPQENGEWRCA
jgi:hypothetical protein